MALSSYLNFDLRIEREEGRFRARVADSPSGQATTAFDLPFSDLELENFLLRLRPGRIGVRRLESSEMQAAKDFGGRLFNAVFAGDVRACLRTSVTEAENRAAGLRIRLHLLDAPELINVPWEFAYDPTVNRFLTLSIETPLVRYMDMPERVRPLSVRPPLRILVMIASARDYPPLDVDQEWSRLNSALADLQERGVVALELLPEASLAALQRTLRRGEYHIFHFVGHGVFDPSVQDGLLLMVDSAGRGVTVSGQDLGTLLHDHRSLRLAVLNACEGARSTTVDPFAGAGQSLVQQGLPAVIAMQFEISDQAAIILSHEFYGALADGYAVDAALGETRKALYAQIGRAEWATPVLYLRAPDGRIFDIAALAETDLRLGQQINALARRAQEAAAAGRWAEAESAWQAVLNLDPHHAAAKAGALEGGRRRQLESLHKGIKAAMEQADWATAVARLEALLKLDPGNFSAIEQLDEAQRQRTLAELAARARAAEARQQWDLAAQGWQAVLDLAPDDARTTARLATARQEAALADQYAQAVQHAREGRWPAALAGFRQIEAQSPGYRDVQARLAAAERALADDARRAELSWQEAPEDVRTAAPAQSSVRRRTMAWAAGGTGVLVVIALAVFLMPRLLDRQAGAPPMSGGTAGPGSAATALPALVVARVPTPTDTPAPTPTPGATAVPASSVPTAALLLAAVSPATSTATATTTASPTALSTATPSSTATATATLTLTPTRAPSPLPRPTARPAAVSTVPPAAPPAPGMLIAPVLLSPDDQAAISGMTTFAWQWTGPALTDNQGFEVRLWKDGQPDHYGAVAIVSGDARQVQSDVRGAYAFQQGGNGRYYWTIAVAQKAPYQRIGAEAQPRTININVTGGGSRGAPAAPPLP